MKKILFTLILTTMILSCSNNSDTVNEVVTTPNNTETMFAKLNIKWDNNYSYKEYKMNGSSTTPYTETGVVGQIKFIKPNIIKETYNGNTFQTTFTTSGYNDIGCSLLTPDWHNKPTFPYINNVESIYKQNNEIIWSYCYVSGGVYNCKQLKFIP